MKKIKIIALMLLVTLSFGCKEFLDVNHDPNSTETSSVEFVFPAGVESASSVLGGSWTILGAIWSQHWTSEPNAPSFQGEDKYAVQAGDYSYDLRGWESLYTGPLMDFEWVKKDALENENWSYYLMATTMQCYVYQVMADFFEDIPLSEALQEEHAKFDEGEAIYDTLIARLDFALSKDLDAETCLNPGASDLVFGGSMNDWVAFANTLKLKIYIRQIYARPDVANAGIAEMFNDGATFLTSDAKFDAFADESGRDNYLYASIGARGGQIFAAASNTFLSLLHQESDPRLPYIFTEGTGGTGSLSSHGNYRGVLQGDINNTYSYETEATEYSHPIVDPLQPVYFISAVESYFLQAEVALRYGLGDAEALYKAAIDADFARKGVDEEDGDPEDVYGSGKYGEFTGTDEEKLETIIVQKWIALANSQAFETFFEHNRTGYPRESTTHPSEDDFDNDYIAGQFTVSVTGVLTPPVLYPKRLLLPSSEESKNPLFPGRKNLNVPVWWDVREYPY